MLMQPETFAEQSPGAAPFRSAADFFARDDPQFWRRALGQFIPVGDKAALREPLTLLADTCEIAALCQPQIATKAQTLWIWRLASSVLGRRVHGLNRRQTFASGAAAAGDGGRATFRFIA